MLLQISWVTILLIVNNFILLGLVYYFVMRRESKGALEFAMLLLASATWDFGVGMESASLSLEQKIFWSKFAYIGIVSIGPLWLYFAAEFTQQKKWLRELFKNVLWIVPVFVLIMTFTNELHYQVWTTVNLVSSDPTVGAIYGKGLVFYLNMIYQYFLIILGSYFLVTFLAKSVKAQSRQSLLAMMAIMFPWVANIVYVVSGLTFGGVEITPFAFAITGIVLALSIFRYKFLEFMPAAKEAVFRSLINGVVILDTDQIVIDFNPEAKKILSENLERGYDLRKAVSKLPTELCDVVEGQLKKAEFYVNELNRWFNVQTYKTTQKNEGFDGTMVFLYDVTEQKKILQDLVESHHQLSTIIDFLPDPTFVINAKAEVVVWNKAIEKLSQIDAAHMIGKGDYAYAVPFYGKRMPLLVNVALRSDVIANKQYKNVERVGDTLTSEVQAGDLHLWLVAKPLYDSLGNITGAIESMRDITEQRKTELALHDRVATLTKMNDLMLRREERLSAVQTELDTLRMATTGGVKIDAKSSKVRKKRV